MPYAIDENKLNDPTMKVLDISKPPMKTIPHAEFPKVVYLHPVDKTKEHMSKVVNSLDEQAYALARGWRLQPHVQVTPQSDIPEGYEATAYETEPEPKRNRKGTEAS